jgi:hypothetical protein
MGRVAGLPPRSGPNLILLVALIVASGSLASPADEPKPKGSAPKKSETSKAKAKAKDPAAKADDSKPKTSDEKKAEEAAKQKDAALKVAEAYLVLLDKGKFGESWETMTAEVRKGITRRKWVDALGKTRTPYGRLQSRKLNRVQMRATEVAERLDEAWIYTDFRTLDGATSSELVVVCLEKGKDWVVSSYYIGDPDNFPKPPALEEEPKPAGK